MDLIFCAGSRVDSAATRFAGCLRQGGNAPHPSICFVHKDAWNRRFVVSFFGIFLANSSCDNNCQQSTTNGRFKLRSRARWQLVEEYSRCHAERSEGSAFSGAKALQNWFARVARDGLTRRIAQTNQFLPL